MKKVSIVIGIISIISMVGCGDDRLKLPQVKSDPGSIALTSKITTAELIVYTNPAFNFTWKVTYKPEWLEVSPSSGSMGGYFINVTALTSNLLIGKLDDKIIISTSTNEVEIPVSLNITESTAIQLNPADLVFNYDENSKQVSIKNNSNKSVNWQLLPSVAFLNITPASGSLNAGQSSNLVIAANRSNLESKIYSESLSIKVDGVTSSQVPVSILNYKETKMLLSSPVIDSEYDRTGDNLIIVTEDNKLLKLKPETEALSSLSLPFAPTCVSVGTDGHFAVVGHNAWITLVDLTTMKIEKSYPVSTNALDVVLAPNFWAYVFPKQDQWENIRCINLQDGSEMLHTGRQIYAGTKAKLHPSGDYIYGANNWLTPSDAEKYDIRAGQANFLYDSPYHGDYEFSGDLWMADDGSKMFTKSRNAFRLSTDQNLDMLYGGVIPGNGMWIKTLDHNSSKNRICVVMFEYFTGSPKNEVRIFSGDFLNDLGTKPLPDFITNTADGYKMIPSEGHFGFFNASGSKYFAVVKSGNNPGFPNQWAVATLTFD